MKKMIFAVLIAAFAMTFTSCDKKDGAKKGAAGEKISNVTLKTHQDSISYALSILNTQGINQAPEQLGIDSTMIDEFLKGIEEGFNSKNDKKKFARQAGIGIGTQLSVNFGKMDEQLQKVGKSNALDYKMIMAAIRDNMKGNKPAIEPMAANMLMQGEMTKVQQIEQKRGKEYMEKKSKEKDVKALQDSIFYKVIKEGTGKQPTDTSTVMIEYELKDMDGKVLDTTKGKSPAMMNLAQTIPGFQKALKSMKEGSEWEVYIPSEQAYGNAGGRGPQGPLTFWIKFIEIKK